MSLLTFKYSARDPHSGKKIISTVQADSEASAAKLISSMSLAPLDITLKDANSGGIFASFTNRISAKDKILFTRQLATLINAGMPLMQSLRMVLAQTQNKALKLIISQIISDIEAGTSFAEVLKKHPKVFSPIYVSLVEAGEASGTLDSSLERLAFQQEKDSELLSKVRGALVYPIIVLVVMAAVVVFMLVSVLPQVQELYKGFKGAKLPFLTQALLALSKFTTKFWWLVIIIWAVVIVSARAFLKTPAGVSFADEAKMRVPLFGPLFQKLYMARFTRTAATLVASGVPLIRILEITSDAVGNTKVGGTIRRAIDKVRGGKALSEALENDKYFIDLVPSMLRIGEQSGQIEGMLGKTADYFEKEVDTMVKNISTIIEPALMVMMGIIAILIVSAVLLPIYALVGSSR